MKIAFNPSTVEALIAPPNNKDITFDLRGRNIFARGVKFCGTDTNTWRDIKINNVSIGSHTLDLRNGSNTTLTNTNGVVTINSTWRPVVDNLTSDSTTSSLSAKQGKILKSLIDGKSNSGHTHDDRYLKLTGGTMASNALITFADSGSWGTDKGPQGARGGLYWKGQSDYAKLYAEETAGDNLDLVIQFGDDNSNGLSIRNASNVQTSYISAGGIITAGTFKGNLDWSYITNKPSSYTPSAHTHAWNSLTHSSTTENQAILTNGKANGWKLYTLNISRWDNAANNAHSHANKSILDGITSGLVNNWNTAYTFVNTITGTDTDKVINKWDEIVNFLAGITEDNKLNTLLNSKLSILLLSAKDILTTKTNNALFWVNTKGNASTITTGPFTDHPYALLSVTNYNLNAENSKFFYRSRLAFSSTGDIKVASCHHENEYKLDETWYNVLTSKNSGINGSTIKLNGTSITVYSSSTADGRYVKKSGDTMSGVLTIDTTNFGALTIKRNDDANYASIQFRGKSNVYGYIGLNSASKDKLFSRFNSEGSKIYTILDTSSTYTSNGRGVINGTTITLVSNADTTDGVHLEWSGQLTYDLYSWLAAWTNDGKKIKAVNKTQFATSGHNHDNRYLKLTGGTMQLGEGLKFHANDNYFGTNADARIISLLDNNDKICDGGLIIDERATLDGKEYVTELLRIRDSEFKWRGNNILHGGNYSSILDSRYYTESEVNTLLSKKLDRVNLTTGTWNPRGYSLAADYSYNGGDLSISESGGKIHISVDGYFWLNEGQYRVLDTSDVAGLKNNLTVHLYLSNTDTTWWPLIWGGSSHNNTSDSTGTVYKSYEKLSWLTSSLTLHATNIQTNNIKNLSIGGGIYWNPYVESASDGSDAASITLVKSGVAGGTTLVLSLMNDANDTILFKTSDAARLYHNSNFILTSKDTKVTSGKGYINNTEITLVNNATNATKASRIVNWYSSRPTSLNAQFGDGSLRIFYATSSTTEGKSPNDATVLHLAWDNNGGWDSQLAINSPSSRVYSRAQNSGTWQPWKTLAFTTDIPSSLKNPHALTISLNGTSQGPYDGSAAKNINITPSSIGAATSNHTHPYLPLSGGTVTGNIILKGGTSADMTYAGNVHPYIRFDNSDSSLNVSLIFTDYDTYRRPSGIKLVGNQGNEWFEANNIYATTFYGALSGNASSANKLTTARNIALGTDLRGSANFDGSSNITINANINACTVRVGSTNGLPFKRIAHFETGSSWNDNSLLLYISLGYINGSNGICRVEFRTDNISSSSTSVTASAAVRWLVRNGYGLDSLYAGYYVTTSKAYIDIYLKTTGGLQGTVIRVLLDSRGGINSNVLLINSYYYSDTNHKEAYNSIEAASTALYNRAYTRIVSGSDVGTVSHSNSTGSVHWNNVTNKPSSFTPSSHTHTWTSITDKLVAGNEFNIVNAGFNAEIWFNYRPINDSSKTATITGYHFGNGATGYTLIKASGFIKNGSSSSYVLLGDGSHKLESSLNVANADKVDGYHASSLWRSDGATWNPNANISLTASGNNQEWSFDIRRNGYTGCYWHVWDSTLSTLLKVNADNGKVYAPYNFVGNLEGNASSASKWLTARTFTIGNTSKNVDGSSNVSWSLSEIGAAPSSHSHNYAANENYGGFTKSGRLPISGFYQSTESESGGNAPWSGWMHLINCLHSHNNNYALLIAASFFDNNTFKIRVTNNNVNNAWRDIIHSGNIGSQTVANAYHLRINSANTWSTWYWAGLSGLPSWLWGSNDGTNMYVWDPNNFNVNTALYLRSLGNLNCQTGRTLNYGDVYSYNTIYGNTGAPTDYTSVIGFGRGIGGTVEIAGGWCNTGLYWRSLRDCCEDWYSWRTVLDSSNYTGFVDNYYWANVKISTSSSTTTSPTVSNLTATSSIRMGTIYLLNTNEINSASGLHLNYQNSGNVSLCEGGGKVGIGTTAPSYKLDVNGDIRSLGTINCNALNVGKFIINDSDINNTSSMGAYFKLNGKTIMYYNSGAVNINKSLNLDGIACLLGGLALYSSLSIDKRTSTDTCSVLIGSISNFTFTFKKGVDGLILFMKWGDASLDVRVEGGCEIIRSDNFYHKTSSYGDGKSRIFIYLASAVAWYEFYCG